MSGFKLDTSGFVLRFRPEMSCDAVWRWSDLLPFDQGYIEAALADGVEHDCGGYCYPELDGIGFSDLAPSTLAAMLEDCERMAAVAREPDADLGRTAWNLRQFDKITDYAAVTLYLADDGKIHQREAR